MGDRDGLGGEPPEACEENGLRADIQLGRHGVGFSPSCSRRERATPESTEKSCVTVSAHITGLLISVLLQDRFYLERNTPDCKARYKESY